MNNIKKHGGNVHSFRWGWMVLILSMMLGMCLTACHKKEENTNEPFKVKIGVLLDFTGDKSEQSEQIYRAAQLAVEEINDSGGVLTEGFSIELIRKDDMGNYMNSVAGYYQLVEEGVCAVIGTNNTEGMEQLVSVSAGANVPVITPSITNGFVVDASNFTFQSCFSDKYMTKALADYAVAELKLKNTALVYAASNERNIALYEDFATTALSEGMEISYAAEVDELNEAVLDELFAQIVKSEAEAVFIPAAVDEMTELVFSSAQKNGYKGVFLGLPEYAQITETEGYELYVPCNMAVDNADVQVKNFVKKLGEVSCDGVRPAYDAVYMLRDAIEAGYLATPASIALKLPFLEGETVLGLYTVGAYGDIQKSVDFIRIKDGEAAYCGTVFE